MRATEILSGEHRVIERVLSCLENMTDRLERDGRLVEADGRDAVDFFGNFADKCHHGKEEARLFPALEAKGFPAEGGPTGIMRSEHDIGRGHVRSMAESLDGAVRGDQRAAIRFVAHARAFIDLLRAHIWKEDNRLFPMADNALSDSDQESLLRDFHHVESDHMGAGTHERYLALADRLGAAYGVPAVAAEGGRRACGCGGH